VLDIPSFLGSARLDAEDASSKKTAMRINGGACVTATWIVGGRRANAAS